MSNTLITFDRADLEGLHYRTGQRANVRQWPADLAPPANATNAHWDRDTLTLTYEIPATEEGEEPTPGTITLTQEQIDTIAATPEPVDLDSLKAAKLAEIKEACRSEYTSDITTEDGLFFHADLETIIDVQTIVDQLTGGQIWPSYKCPDGVYRDITREQFQAALTAGAARKGACFSKRAALETLIAAATTPADLAAIQW